MGLMEVLRLIVAAGRRDPDTKSFEICITDAGRAELEERQVLSSSGLSDGEA
ncbi:hypothetical protein [Methylobacterium fujisawaense]|uniref:hypothetical protein n=1 Tax=Methylobacterium fujisawaense TaxID=107400 RepID=UPI002F34F6F5